MEVILLRFSKAFLLSEVIFENDDDDDDGYDDDDEQYKINMTREKQQEFQRAT